MDFTERLSLYKEGGMINEADEKDILAVIDLFANEYKVELTEENAGTFIAHLCSAYFRLKQDEDIDILPDEVKDELLGLDTYDLSTEILDKILKVTANPLNEVEQGYALLHINNIIANLKSEGKWQY